MAREDPLGIRPLIPQRFQEGGEVTDPTVSAPPGVYDLNLYPAAGQGGGGLDWRKIGAALKDQYDEAKRTVQIALFSAPGVRPGLGREREKEEEP